MSEGLKELSHEIGAAAACFQHVTWKKIQVDGAVDAVSGTVLSTQSGVMLADLDSWEAFNRGIDHLVGALQQIQDLL